MRPHSVGASRCQLGNEAIIEDLLAQIKVKRKTPESSSLSPVPQKRVLSPLQTKKSIGTQSHRFSVTYQKFSSKGERNFSQVMTQLLHHCCMLRNIKEMAKFSYRQEKVSQKQKQNTTDFAIYMSYALHEQPKSVIVTHFLCYSRKYTNL